MSGGDFLSVEDAARVLGVSTRHVRRLADSGAVERVARGLIDRGSVERFVYAQRRGRTRAWAEHTAWGAVAMLSGVEADWLGSAQASRLRRTLRLINDPAELLPRVRDRASVETFDAHRAALPRLHELVVKPDLGLLGISEAMADRIDGYLGRADVDRVVRSLGLRAQSGGAITLRSTGFDFIQVRALVPTSQAVAAIHAATSTEPRLRGLGRRAVAALLEAFR